jgi:ceramide glucosyltransferase
MAYAMRSTTVDTIGGFGAMMTSVTDDLAVARRVLAAGGRICQTASPVWVQTTVVDGPHYVRQMHRWFLFASLLIRSQPPGMRMLVVALHATPPLLLWAAVVGTMTTGPSAGGAALATVLILRAGALAGLQWRIYGRPIHHPVSSVVSELLQPLHMIHALLQRSIAWRTRRYVVHSDQTFEVQP